MEKRKEKRNRLIKLRVSEAELKEIHQHLGRSTNRSLSEYLRRLALNKPVTVMVRNASADDFLEQMLPLQACLEQTCNTYTRAVDRLPVLNKIPELKGWLILHESTRAALLEQVSR
ncbi:plasmid mobilization protein, partial [Cnuella takakiae]